jgi:hypothetical protein
MWGFSHGISKKKSPHVRDGHHVAEGAVTKTRIKSLKVLIPFYNEITGMIS